MARDAGGLAAFVSTGDDFGRQADAFRRKLMRPAATNVKIAFDGGDVYDVEPQELPNLYHGQPVRIYGRYRRSGPLAANIEADILGNPMKQTISLTLPEKDDANPEIERMWASHRVERLADEGRRTGSRGLAQDEIVRLCEGYSIVSEYASFIVLENDAEFARWKIERRNVTRVQRDRRAQEALRLKLEELRRQTQANLGPINAAANRELALAQDAVPAPTQSAGENQPAIAPANPSSGNRRSRLRHRTPRFYRRRRRWWRDGSVLGPGHAGPGSVRICCRPIPPRPVQ